MKGSRAKEKLSGFHLTFHQISVTDIKLNLTCNYKNLGLGCYHFSTMKMNSYQTICAALALNY